MIEEKSYLASILSVLTIWRNKIKLIPIILIALFLVGCNPVNEVDWPNTFKICEDKGIIAIECHFSSVHHVSIYQITEETNETYTNKNN